MKSFLGAPVKARGKVFGNIYLTEKQHAQEFSAEDEQALVVLATQAGMAVENARLHEEARERESRLAVMDDRERIAKELHDGVIQALFAVGMGLQATAVVSKDPELEHRVEGAVNDIDRVIRDLRNYIFGLRPGILADRQLDQALRALAEDFQEKNGVITVVEVDSAIAAQLASQAGDVVQLAREALSNVGRHAKATTCRVSLMRGDGAALLEIDDDGAGFDPAVAESGDGQGLRNLRDRATAMGGHIAIDTVSGEGTTVRVTFPL